MRKEGLIGFVLIAIGLLLIVNSFSGITGFIIFDDLRKEYVSIVGLILIGVGFVILRFDREERGGYKPVSRYHVRHENGEAHQALRWAYTQKYGHPPPDKRQLDDFRRSFHEKGEIGDLIDQWKEHGERRRKAA